MRIALICPYSLTAVGGVQDQVVGLARELRLLGHAADVLAPCDGTPPTGAIGVGRSLSFRVNGSTAPMAPTPAAAIRVVQRLTHGSYDIVHLHEPLAPSITIPALLAHPAPVIGTFHAAGTRTPYPYLAAPLHRLARRIDVRIAVSQEAGRLVHRYLGGGHEVLFNGIDARPYATAPPTPVDRRMVLFLGRHEARKGLQVLLQAMNALPDDVVLWVGGDGPEQRRLRRRFGADRRIRWLGRVSEQTKISHLRAASVVCAPSLNGESFGMVLLEAMAAGTPVVASDLPGYRALSAEGSAAMLIPPGDPAALATGLRRVLGDPRLASELRVAGTERVAAFAFDDLARRYLAIYQRVVASASEQ